MSHKDIENYLCDNSQDISIVTLHGYLRILSHTVCDQDINIFNGHPAPIHIYPELKGKDKQEDQYIHRDKYLLIGTVIHRVTAELDSGEIECYNDEINYLKSVDDAYRTLKKMSLDLWIEFIEGWFEHEN